MKNNGNKNQANKRGISQESNLMRGALGSNNTDDTPENAMTHDVVVGGGHTIEVQREDGSQITDFAVQESSPRVNTPNADNTVSATNRQGATPNADGTVGIAGQNSTKKATKRSQKDLFRDNFGQVPPCVNSVYGNTDRSRRDLGDFYATANEKTPQKSEKSEKNTQKSEEKDTEKDGAVAVKSGQKLIKTIVIAGQIEGHTQLPPEQKSTKYEELIPQLIEIEENDSIGGLLLILNTVGGDVEAGLALSELIAGMKKPTASLVLGGGHSIGVPLAVSAKRSFIVPSATMTLHPVRVTGLVLSAPQTYVYLNNMQQRIINFVCSHSKIKSEHLHSLMLAREEMSTDLGSVLDGKKAVEEGLIDAIGTLHDAMKFLSSSDL